jgi:predicted MFS family arabinose efflux permease
MNGGIRALDNIGLRSRLIAILVAIIVASVMALSAASVTAFDRAVEPELANRSRLIGSIIRSEIQHALELSIPFDAIVGLDRYLSETLAKFEEVHRIDVNSVTGRTIASVDRPAKRAIFEQNTLSRLIRLREDSFVLPILDGNELVGEISIQLNPLFIQSRLRGVFLDVLVIALVAALVAMEMVMMLIMLTVGKPFDGVFLLLGEQRRGRFLHTIRPGGLGPLARVAVRLNDHAEDLAERLSMLPEAVHSSAQVTMNAVIAKGRPLRLKLSEVSDIRIALFLFSVATEVAVSFLPLYAREVARPFWLSPELAAAAPLILYLAAVTMITPFSGALVRYFGARRLFLYSVPPAVLALAAIGFSDSLLGVTLWRGVMAVFYATATIACQEYAIRAAKDRESAHTFGTFIAVVYGGVFCGSALGGVIAGRFGYLTAFVTGAVIAALSGALGMLVMQGQAGDPEVTTKASRKEFVARRLLKGRFLALLFGIAVPMNASVAIFIWYLTPMILSAGGSGPAEIGRVVMLYYLAIVLFGPTAANISDSRVGPRALMLCGALASSAALMSLLLWSGFWAVTAAVVALGLGHTMIRPSLYTLVLSMSGGPGAGLDTLRLIERIGAILGLAASALLLGDRGLESSLLMLSSLLGTGLILYVTIEFIERYRAGEGRSVC